MTGLADFVQLTGVAVAGLTIFLYHRMVTNHLNASKDALTELSSAIRELKHWLKEHQSHEHR